MTSMQRLGVVLVAVMLLGPTAHAQDWPAFRGPTGQGHSSERGLPLEWSESTNVLWKAPVPGRGWSSPVVADGRVWLTTSTDEGAGSLRLLAYDIETGLEVLNTEVFRVDQTASPNPKNSLASPTPIVDADANRVYVHFGADGTAALTTDGEILWVRFGILRHPRPYAFSRQSHNVLEYWLYDVREGCLRVEKGVNLTRLDDEDASR